MTLKDMIVVTQEDAPSWFEIGLDPHMKFTLQILVHPQVIETVHAQVIQHVVARTGPAQKYHDAYDPFIPPGGPAWGFGGVLLTDVLPNGWQRIRCRLPQIRFPTQGSANWVPTHNVAFSLCVLLETLGFQNRVPPHGRTQLCVPKLYSGGGHHSIHADLAPAMVQWIQRALPPLPTTPEPPLISWVLPSIQQTMHDAFHHMEHHVRDRRITYSQRELYPLSEFGAYIARPHRLLLRVPGNACELHTDGSFWLKEDLTYGYELVPHNTDSPLQTLLLLTGLAKLCDEVRASLD